MIDPDDALDLIFFYVGTLFAQGLFSEVDRYLRSMNVTSLHVSLIVGVLAATLPGKDKLVERSGFVARAEAHLRATEGDRTDALLKGLR